MAVRTLSGRSDAGGDAAGGAHAAPGLAPIANALPAVVRSVAHDFNNLLTAIIGYSDLLLMDIGIGDQRRSDVAEIRAAAEQGARLTAQLRAFCRDGVLRPLPTNVRVAFADINPLLHRLVGADVDLSVPAQPIDAWTPLATPHLQQVILELALLARDAVGAGGLVSLEISERDGTNEGAPRSRADDAAAVLLCIRATPADARVADRAGAADATAANRSDPSNHERSGTNRRGGITSGRLQRRTARADDALTVSRLVRAAGGRLRFGGEPGCPEFLVTLPRLARPSAGPSPSGRSANILLVEHDAAVRELAVSILGRHGHRVIPAADPGTALDLAVSAQVEIDLLITAAALPGMTGPQLARQLAAIGRPSRVLYLRGHAADPALRPEPAGDATTGHLPDATLAMPFTAEMLATAVVSALAEQRAPA